MSINYESGSKTGIAHGLSINKAGTLIMTPLQLFLMI
jgi:hypothetical protein